MAPQTQTGLTVWFTGLSSAGKSTLSRAVFERLHKEGREAEILDGDVIRRELCKDLGFSKQDRDENIRRIGFVADLLCRHGVIVLVSAISPYRAIRDEIRARIGRFMEVYVNAPLAVCEQRDIKGLYSRARSGELQHFTGIDDPYEPPLRPELVCHTDRETVEQSVEKVLAYIRGYLASERNAQRAFQQESGQDRNDKQPDDPIQAQPQPVDGSGRIADADPGNGAVGQPLLGRMPKELP